MLFLAAGGLIVALLHLYLWKRLVHDVTRKRKIGTVALAIMFVLSMTTLVLPRRIGIDAARWLVWPGYGEFRRWKHLLRGVR